MLAKAIKYISLALLVVCSLQLSTKIYAQKVVIHGFVTDTKGYSEFMQMMIVNKNTGHGKFAAGGGHFSITADKNDSIMIGVRGYHTLTFSLKDSVNKDTFDLKFVLRQLEFNLREISVFPERELSEIRSDIESLGYTKSDYMLSGVDAFNSPITFLYEQFSRREKQRRLAYELMNEDKKRDLLKELFTKYVNYDIISLPPEQFDAFIDFINVSDEFMKRTSQYDFIMYVKARYQHFKQLNDYR